MNTTRLAALLLALSAGCAAAPMPGETPGAPVAVFVPISGAWSIHMIPEDRVVTTIPPPCDGSMSITTDDGASIGGAWSCGAGAGTLSGFRVHESGGAWIGFGSDPGGRWLTAWVSIAAARLQGDQLVATRAP